MKAPIRTRSGPSRSGATDLQIQQKPAETQAEFDSGVTQRKILANETEKVYVEIAFHAEQRAVTGGAFTSVSEALRDSRSVLGDSLHAHHRRRGHHRVVDRDRSRAAVPDQGRFRERRRAAKAATPAA